MIWRHDYDDMKTIALITARGGSKGIPRKNVKDIAGKPLIAYTIEAAKLSGACDRVIVTTDDPEIADVSRTWGAEVPFMRPANLAEDKTPTLPVAAHAVAWLKEHESYEPDAVMILQPTTPMRQAIHIREGIELLRASGADSVVSISEIPSHVSPYWAIHLDEQKLMTLLLTGEPFRKRIPQRQLLPKAYIQNGGFFLFRTYTLSGTEPSLYGDHAHGYVMDPYLGVNIDSIEDWDLAEERILELRNSGTEI